MTDTQYASPLPTRLNKATVEKVASFIADKLEFGIGDPIELLVEKLGGEIKIGWNRADEIDGGSIVASSLNDFTIHISELTSPRRDRFTIAHELGHLVLHLSKVQELNPEVSMRATRWIDENDADQQRAEWEANWFAAELLMPRDKFKDVLLEYGENYAAMLFNVSKAAAHVRAKSV
jgi:Zn-dependent peptidase ImmA (M78 family)